jgi:hypothetical protein
MGLNIYSRSTLKMSMEAPQFAIFTHTIHWHVLTRFMAFESRWLGLIVKTCRFKGDRHNAMKLMVVVRTIVRESSYGISLKLCVLCSRGKMMQDTIF